MHPLKAVPELATAGLLFALWAEPQRFSIEWFRSGVLTLLLEFFVIHAGGFMGVLLYDPESSRRKRSLQLAGLGAGYLLFIGAFAWGFDAGWMVIAFAWLCFSKLQAIWTGAAPTENDRWHAMSSWALSVAVFLGAVGLTVSLDVPALGVTADMAFDPKGGAWEAEPNRALAGGVLYFAVMGLARPVLSWTFARSSPRSPTG